jgi:hypothetical protein
MQAVIEIYVPTFPRPTQHKEVNTVNMINLTYFDVTEQIMQNQL